MNNSRWAGMLLTRLARLSMAQNDKIFSQFGLTHKSWLVLFKISKNPDLSTHALAELCLDTDQSLGQVATKLAEKGLIKRKPAFGRAILHEITNEGSRLLEETDPLADNAMQELFSSLNSQQLAELTTLLECIIMGQNDELVIKTIQNFKKATKI